LANEPVLIRATLSHNSGKAQPIFGGAMETIYLRKMLKKSNDYQSYNISYNLEKTIAIGEY